MAHSIFCRSCCQCGVVDLILMMVFLMFVLILALADGLRRHFLYRIADWPQPRARSLSLIHHLPHRSCSLFGLDAQMANSPLCSRFVRMGRRRCQQHC